MSAVLGGAMAAVVIKSPQQKYFPPPARTVLDKTIFSTIQKGSWIAVSDDRKTWLIREFCEIRDEKPCCYVNRIKYGEEVTLTWNFCYTYKE